MRNPQDTQRRAIAITHMGARNRLIDMPWFEDAYEIDASDWIVLSAEGWRAMAEGEATIWDALERKLLIGFYLNEPELIAVIAHPDGRDEADSVSTGLRDVRHIVRRVRALLLPTAVVGFWTDDHGLLADAGKSEESAAREDDTFTHEEAPVA